MSRTRCNIDSVTTLTDTVYKVLLTPEQSFDFKPGQYLTIVMDEEDKRPFSIASKPSDQQIELHIGAFVAESYAMQVIERLTNADTIEIEAPFGQAHLRPDDKRSRILVAGGTGFSYVHSIIEHLIETNDRRTTFLYWGCRDQQGMYLRQQAELMAQRHPHLRFIPVFDTEVAGERQGSVIEAVCEDFTDLAPFDIYVAGRFEMAGVAKERFVAQGAGADNLIGDAFSYLN